VNAASHAGGIGETDANEVEVQNNPLLVLTQVALPLCAREKSDVLVIRNSDPHLRNGIHLSMATGTREALYQ
jgi:hypothetical protein